MSSFGFWRKNQSSGHTGRAPAWSCSAAQRTAPELSPLYIQGKVHRKVPVDDLLRRSAVAEKAVQFGRQIEHGSSLSPAKFPEKVAKAIEEPYAAR